VMFRTAMLAALSVGGGELERRGLAEGYDIFDREPVLGSEAGPAALAPDYSRDDQMIAATQLNLGPARNWPAGMDHQPARRDVEDAGVAPRGAVAEPRGHHDAPPELARFMDS
jgi:hypothetical protein